MHKILFTALLFCSATSMNAQQFIEQLERDTDGQGTITVTEDQRLTNMINTGDVSLEKPAEPVDLSATPGIHVITRKKVRGYRIQMYWGNSSRTDQQKAQNIGNRVKAMIPGIESYVTFESPHWRCRVGDFLTREEAAKYLTQLRRIAPGAMIVRSEILTTAQP